MSEVIIDLDQAHRFLRALTGEERPAVCWQTFADPDELKEDKSLAVNRTMPLSAIEMWLVGMNRKRAGVFVTVNATDGRGRLSVNVTGLRALFVDCDGTSPLPESWPLAPSIVVQRDATHWHAYWLLVPGQPLTRFEAGQVQLAAHWRTDASVKDLPRVMRCPGFIHHKRDPMAVELRCAHSGLRYTVDEIIAAHPVDWPSLHHDRAAIAAVPESDQPSLQLADAYYRAALRAGLVDKAAPAPAPPLPPPPPTSRSSPAARSRPGADLDLDYDLWHIAQFRKWASHVSTAEGAGNPRGGRDKAAFQMACEGAGRVDQVGGRFDRGVVDDVVRDYLQRAGVPDVDGACDRIVGSAFSEPRQPHALPQRPQRRSEREPARERRDVGDPFADNGAPPPPPPPAAPPAAGGDGPNWDGLNVKLLEQKWVIGPNGVAPVAYDSREREYVVKPNNRVSDLPIWPVREGRDLATGGLWWEIAWATPHGARDSAWLTEEAFKRGHELVALRGAPITQQQCERCATWLTAARSAVTNAHVDVTSRVGWVGHNGSRRWVWPTASKDGARYVGEDLGEVGDLQGWRSGADHLLNLPDDDGYTGLVVLGFALGAPFARLAGGGRRPVIGLMAQSSTGKGSVLNYAVSAWCESRVLSQMASSSIKGIQDRGVQFPDCPIVVDDLQQLHQYDPRQAHEVVYFLGNGQRRTTSSKAQKAVGGELRYGVGFYAAESPILQGANLGANLRVIELTTDPCPDEATAKALARATGHAGGAAAAMAAYLATRPAAQWAELLGEYTSTYRTTIAGLRGSDAECLAILHAGLVALGDVLGSEVPVAPIVAWLGVRIQAQRDSTVDRETLCLQALLDQVCNGHWREDESQEGRDGQLVAWRKTKLVRDVWEEGEDGVQVKVPVIEMVALEINTAADGPSRILRDYGGETRVLTSWARRKWIRTDGRHLKCKKDYRGKPAGRVLRLTQEALALYQGSPQEQPATV